MPTAPCRPARTLLAAAILALAAMLSGCAVVPPPAEFRPLSFADRERLRLDVAGIDIENRHAPSFQAPYVEHLMPLAPGPAAENWAGEVLRAVGGTGRARIIIEDAGVTASELPVTGGLKGLFTVDQSVRYDARLTVRIEILGSGNQVLAQARATAHRSRTAGEDLSPNQRTMLWHALTQQLLDDFDSAIRPPVHEYLARYLR